MWDCKRVPNCHRIRLSRNMLARPFVVEMGTQSRAPAGWPLYCLRKSQPLVELIRPSRMDAAFGKTVPVSIRAALDHERRRTGHCPGAWDVHLRQATGPTDRYSGFQKR